MTNSQLIACDVILGVLVFAFIVAMCSLRVPEQKSLPEAQQPTEDELRAARIVRDASLYLHETLDELNRAESENWELDHALAVGRREAVHLLHRIDSDNFAHVPRGGLTLLWC